MAFAAGAPAPLLDRLGAQQGETTAAIAVDYPEDGSLFPPDMAAPTFLWRDPAGSATRWEIRIAFSDGTAEVYAQSEGERLRIGKVDPRCVAATNEPPRLTDGQAAAHSWVPDAATWEAIGRHAVGRPAVLTISGFTREGSTPVSGGRVSLSISKDHVGAPVFYRDVPLMPSELERGLIKPLAPTAVPLIAWRLRNVAEPRSRLLLEGLPTCANCHSFSNDGKTLGMDIDGPENDKGTYALSPVAPQMLIRNEDVITWNSFPGKAKDLNTLGFMAQVSPDGRYAATTLNEEVYVANFKDYRFLQVFYPTRGILGWYDRSTGRMAALPGADDPRYVQTNAVWSPDGRYLVFARAEARDAYPPGRPFATRAGDPNETPVQYDLYRIPFNGGKGGRAEPIAGASRNGMSNSFAKVSPDGRWIVFVQARNGLLMRPDSRLYIIPWAGGTPRLMRCNTPLMNSWHSFSPNGSWLVFSSKSRSPYTQMFLTHLDEQGNDSPAILIENSTAANRAVNIPEFVNIKQDELLSIDVPAAGIYRLFDAAMEQGEKGQWDAAIDGWRKVLAADPGNAKAHNNLGVALMRQGSVREAIAHFRRAIAIKPAYDRAQFNLGGALAQQGDWNEAIAHWKAAVTANPEFGDAFAQLGAALAKQGRLGEAVAALQRALEIDPKMAEAQNDLGIALFGQHKLAEAIEHFREAAQLDPRFAPAHYNLGRALAATGALPDAAAAFRKALQIEPGYKEAAAAVAALQKTK